MSIQLINNFHQCSSSLLTIKPKKSLFDLQICAIVVHTTVTLLCNNSSSILNSLQVFIQPTSDIKVSIFFYVYMLLFYYYYCYRIILIFNVYIRITNNNSPQPSTVISEQ